MNKLIRSSLGALLLTFAVGFLPVWKVWYNGSWELTEGRGTLFLHVSQVLAESRSIGLIEAVHQNYERNLSIWATTLVIGAALGYLCSLGIHLKAETTKA